MQTNSDSGPVEKAGRFHTLRRFPDHWAAIKAMFEDNEDFRLLCIEYGLASEKLSMLYEPQDSKTRMMRDEYMKIIREQETEIRNYILAKDPITGDSSSITVSQKPQTE